MKYKKDELKEMALEAIRDNNIVTVTELIPFLPITRTTFYYKGLDKDEDIKDAVTRERLCLKHSLKRKWADSDNATLQVALMKLLAEEEEWLRLNSQRHQVETETTGSIITFNFS
jgi:hypothetical protein